MSDEEDWCGCCECGDWEPIDDDNPACVNCGHSPEEHS